MHSPEKIQYLNARILHLLGAYLNQAPDFVNAAMMNEVTQGDPAVCELAYASLLAAACGLDTERSPDDRALMDEYLLHMVHQLDPATYRDNPFCKNIVVPECRVGRCELKAQSYRPYEAFVCDDLACLPDGRCLPQIGFFDCELSYPALLEQGRVWMTVTPNEVETMGPAIAQASGNVLTFGLGLGYYAYMVSEKDAVEAITVVEQNDEIIRLFETRILPQFPHAEKVRVVRADAFAYAESHLGDGRFDLVFTDLWHDPSDGVALYLEMKQYEALSPSTTYLYWIERTLQHYLG